MDEPIIVYTTFPDETTARSIAAALVEGRLAACVNLIPGMRSVYRWEGGVSESGEIVGIVKTRASLAAEVEEKVRALHPYDTPVLLRIAVGAADPGTLAWLMAETAQDGR